MQRAFWGWKDTLVHPLFVDHSRILAAHLQNDVRIRHLETQRVTCFVDCCPFLLLLLLLLYDPLVILDRKKETGAVWRIVVQLVIKMLL
jgi:hypothetical protein